MKFGALLFCTAMLCSAGDKAATTITIKDATGKVVGKGMLTKADPRGVSLDLNIKGLPPGDHLFHIHQKPVCEADEEFNTAGLQYDPTGAMYGNEHHHAGSGPSAGNPGMTVKVNDSGVGHVKVVFPALTLDDSDHSVFHNGGTAIIFHSAPGAKGPTRIACGVIVRP